MQVNGLQIPRKLLTAIDAGRWPRNRDEMQRQLSQPFVTQEIQRNIFPRFENLYLYAPPFSTVEQILHGDGGHFYKQFGALEQIVPSLAIEIADLGLGSDSPVLLDYSIARDNPRVLALDWHWPKTSKGATPQPQNHWTLVAENFTNFVQELGLD